MNKFISYTLNNALALASSVGIHRKKISRLTQDIDMEFYNIRIKKSLKNFSLILKNKKYIGSMLEFGSGAHGIDLMMAYLLGIECLYTVDINNHINPYWAKNANVFLGYIGEMVEIGYRDTASVRDAVKCLTNVNSTEELFKLINCKFYLFNEFATKFSENIDLWYSESNLQRIPLDKISTISRSTINNLNVKGLCFHRLDLGDIYSQPHYPLYIKSLHRFDFLTYSEFLWGIINRNSYSSQNRLRLPQYEELFASFGLVPILIECVIYNEDLHYMKGKKIAKQFSYIPLENLVVSHARVLYEKSDKKNKAKTIFHASPDHW